jgi:hypothetical protein
MAKSAGQSGSNVLVQGNPCAIWIVDVGVFVTGFTDSWLFENGDAGGS